MQILFAPLQGYTDFDFRNTHNAVYGHIDAYYTPFVRLESGGTFRPKDIKDISPERNTVTRLVPQLIASSHDEAAAIVTMIADKGYTEIDINMGCPHRLMTIRGKGAAILSSPDKVADVLSVTNDFPEITFTLKMRTGMENHDECLALAPAINASRLTHVTVHPRTGRQQYTGEADRDAFDRFAQLCDKPLVFNGDLLTTDDIDAVMTRFPSLAGVMVGRGLLANPALAMEWKTGKTLDDHERRALLRRFVTALRTAYEERMQGEKQLLMHLHPMWEYLYPEMEKRDRKRIIKSSKLAVYTRCVDEALR